MRNKVTEFMQRHQLLKEETTVLVGVSGGPDSMALLHFYVSIMDEWKLDVVAISLDHQLRGSQSKADLAYVEEVCRTWQIPFVASSADVRGYQLSHQVSTQVAAREVRYQFFKQQMEKFEADYLALGHHGDDQLETMLMSFARSTSTTALSGIPVKRKFSTGFIVRPFLCLSKVEIMKYCKDHRIQPRIDPSNEDETYTRNYFRKQIIPLIKEKNSNIHTTVQRLSESLQEDEKYLQKQAKQLLESLVTFNENHTQATFMIREFKSHSVSLQRRVYHLILNYLYGDTLPKNLSYTHEDIFFSILEHDEGHMQVDFPNQLTINRCYDKVAFQFNGADATDTSFHYTLHVPGVVMLPDGSRLTATYQQSPDFQRKNSFVLQANNTALPLYVRTRKPGDRMSWKGLKGRKKIKDIFIDEKIPRDQRDTWPIVTDHDGEIIWLVGLRKKQMPIDEEASLFIQIIYEDGKV